MRYAALLAFVLVAACAHVPAPSHAVPAFAIAEGTVDPLAPIALDANDGTALDLTDLKITVTMHGPIAHTSVHATFVNPFSQQMEGRFRLVMPPRSSISRLAMKMGGSWREAEAAETMGVARISCERISRCSSRARFR